MTSKTKLKMKKFTNLQRQERRIEPMKPEETKYIKELLQRINNENIPTNLTREFTTPTYLTQSFLLVEPTVVSPTL